MGALRTSRAEERTTRALRLLSLAAVALGAGACASSDPSVASSPGTDVTPSADAESATGPSSPAESTGSPAARHPDIVTATATWDGASGTWSFDVTISSPYDSPERYADGWRVVAPNGEVLGEHVLTHDHAAEQPFTRRQTGVSIPDDVSRVTIEGHDRHYGYGGTTATIELER